MIKALLVGINTYASQSGLMGCVNDVKDIAALLKSRGVLDSDITELLDASATTSGIMTALKALISGAKSGDRLYFHFSGHGVQLPSQDPRELDGADEVLCPHDFDWTAQHAIRDDDLLQIINQLPNGARLTVTVDSCHSGDFSRRLKRNSQPRTLPPPAEVRSELLHRSHVRSLRAISLQTSCAFVSACLPWQEAADTTFDERANGAFSYFFVGHARGNPEASLEAIASALVQPLAPYNMTPLLEGSDAVKSEAYLTSRRHLTARSSVIQLPRRATTVWQHTVSAHVFGCPVWLSIRISESGGNLTAYVATDLLGGAEWVMPLEGNNILELDLMAGVKIKVTIRDWKRDHATQALSMQFAVITPQLPRALEMGRVSAHFELDTQVTRAAYQATTAADLAALISLTSRPVAAGALAPSATSHVAAGASSKPLPAFTSREGEIALFDDNRGRQENYGPNWSEDRFIAARIPLGGVRSHVSIHNLGAAQISFIKWDSDQETDGNFWVHIGNHFFGGWGHFFWNLHGSYQRQDPFPRSVTAKTNGSSAVRSHEPAYISSTPSSAT